MSSYAATALETAQEVAEKLAVITSSLSVKLAKNSTSADCEKIAFSLSTLSTQLHSVHSCLSRPDTAVSQSLRLTKRFLEHLERACTCHINGKPAPNPKSPYPTLNALAALRLADGELAGTTNTIEAQRRAKRTQASLQKGLEKYASANKNVKKQFKDIVDKLVKAKSGGTTNSEAPKGVAKTKHEPRERLYEPPYDVVQRLYKALCDYSCYCNCNVKARLNGSAGHHAVRLSVRLETVMPNKELTQFDISISRMLEPFESQTKSYWQHLRLYVPNLAISNTLKKAANRGVKRNLRWKDSATKTRDEDPSNSRAVAALASVNNSYSTNPTSGDSTKNQTTLFAGSETVLEAKEFCDFLQRDFDEVRLCFRVEREAFIELNDAVEVEPRIGQTTSISLAQVLRTEKLSTKIRLRLAYSVARSIWLYYNSDWMKKPWTCDSIHFMPEANSNGDESSSLSIPNTSNPCFALQFDSSEETCPETHEVKFTLHKYPRVRALGNILLELGRDHSAREAAIPNQPDPSVRDGIAKAINQECTQALKTIDERNWPDFDIRDKDQVNIYKEAVKSCFRILKLFNERALFDTLLNSDVKRNIDVINMRSIDELPIDVQITLRRGFLYQKVVAPLEKLLQNAEIVKLTEIANIAAISGANTETTDAMLGLTPSQKESKEWLDAILTSTAFRNIYEKSRNRSPIKIAVLDTGYDSEAIFFQNRYRKRQLKSGNWLDCLRLSKKPVDNDGHGSYVVSLAMKLAPAAEIYVARVAENTASLEASSKNIEEAIIWATSECGVDIVTMSFGFPQERPVYGKQVISLAILKAVLAREKRILFFSAASNSGANGPEQFPATHEYVISVRATHPSGASWERNPPIGNHGEGFGTLGTEVPAAWLKSDPQGKVLSGTSVATPIAAGMAAMLLGYADADDEVDDEIFRRLQTQEGMVALFRYISEDCGGFHYISPLKFLGDHVGDSSRRSMMDLATRDKG